MKKGRHTLNSVGWVIISFPKAEGTQVGLYNACMARVMLEL